jgi:predicted TIM-barrel fold metal-dependent hydrolase
VQPANHAYDHSYVTKVLKEHPTFFRGMGLANPTVPPAEAVAALEALKADGFVGVRFNAGAFEGGLTSPVAKALYARAGELGMPVGVMAFKGLGPFVPALQTLCDEYPATQLVIDHLGFFRQPAIGGQLGNAAANDEASWRGLLSLAKYPQVYVKVSALFRASGDKPPFFDLQPRVAELLEAYGASRLMWGSDFPFVLPGGFPLPEGVTSTPAALTYADAAQVTTQWQLEGLDEEARAALMGGTAAKLFQFE